MSRILASVSGAQCTAFASPATMRRGVPFTVPNCCGIKLADTAGLRRRFGDSPTTETSGRARSDVIHALHILDGGFQSGAGRGCLWLQEGLKLAGVDSRFLGRLGAHPFAATSAQEVAGWERFIVRGASAAYRRYLKCRYSSSLRLFSPLQPGYRLHRYSSYASADIIHIHWTNGTTFSRGFWQQLVREQRPVVWTVRDMWPLTGGCHYSADCIAYTSGCGGCPILGDVQERLTSRDAAFKRDHLPSHGVFVAISEWLRQQALQSFVLAGRDVRVIHNCLPADQRFRPVDRAAARAALGIPDDAFVACAAALNFAAPYKGAAVLGNLVERFGTDPGVRFVFFGGNSELIAPLEHPHCRHMGRVADDASINQLYAAADVFLMTSLQEAFGKATVESMAAGTPVIGFKGTATEEIIEAGRTGWLAPHGDVEAYASCFAQARGLVGQAAAAMREACAQTAYARFSSATIGSQYADLYRELLRARSRRPPLNA
jgi:glycosyltransferase involved in cell wall biosynthesis